MVAGVIKMLKEACLAHCEEQFAPSGMGLDENRKTAIRQFQKKRL